MEPIERKWIKQQEEMLTIPIITDHLTGVRFPVMLPCVEVFVDELAVWAERERRR